MYIPIAGGFIIQALIGLVGAALIILSIYRGRIKQWFKKRHGKTTQEASETRQDR